MNDISRALDAKLWVVALHGALALPDICAALESPDGRTAGARYRDWFSRYLSAEYPRLDADEVYQLRCSMLHQGLSATRKYPSIIFSLPTNPSRMHNNTINGMHNVDIGDFCNDMNDAVIKWYGEHKEDAAVIANYPRLLKRAYYEFPFAPMRGQRFEIIM